MYINKFWNIGFHRICEKHEICLIFRHKTEIIVFNKETGQITGTLNMNVISHLFVPGRGRRGRDDEEAEDVQNKPSAPATLFDQIWESGWWEYPIRMDRPDDVATELYQQ